MGESAYLEVVQEGQREDVGHGFFQSYRVALRVIQPASQSRHIEEGIEDRIGVGTAERGAVLSARRKKRLFCQEGSCRNMEQFSAESSSPRRSPSAFSRSSMSPTCAHTRQ